MASCVKDGPAGGNCTREIELRFTKISAATRAVADDAIVTVDILVFDGRGADTDNAKFLYSRYAWEKGGGVYATVLKTGSELDLYFAVNARDIVNGALTEGMTWSQAKTLLTMADPQNVGLDSGLPMWGFKLDHTISEGPAENLGVIRLLRSVASVDVTVTASNFSLGKGYLVYCADKGSLPFSPGNAATDAGGLVSGIQVPEPPASMATGAERSHTIAPGDPANAIVDIFYMYENDAPAGGRKNTKVILEGRWSGSQKTENTFYPLSLRNKTTGEKMTVKRNAKFIIVVTGVHGDGYPTIDDAKEAEDLNVEYDVIEWNEWEDADIIVDGPYWFSIPSKSVLMPRDSGKTAELRFSTNIPVEDVLLRLADTDEGTAVLDAHPRFKVEVVQATDADGNPYNCFRVTNKLDYGTDDNPATIVVTAGRIRFTLTVAQLDRSDGDWEWGGDTDFDFGKI